MILYDPKYQLRWLLFCLLVAWQDYGDVVEVDGFDIDYGVSMIFYYVRIIYKGFILGTLMYLED